MKPKLTVAICTYNRTEKLAECLKSLERQSLKDFEVLIIDGGSAKETNPLLKKFEKTLDIKRKPFKEAELSKARDLGWRLGKGAYISWIDDDVSVAKNWAENIVSILDKNKDIGGVSGPTLIPKTLLKGRDVFTFYEKKGGLLGMFGKIWNSFFLENNMYKPGLLLKSGAWTPGSNFESSLKIKGFVDVDYLEACNMTLRRDLIKRVKGFDFGYKGIGEWSELDLSRRVKELGYRLVFSKEVRVSHNVSTTGAYVRRPQAKLRMKNFLKFYFRHIFKPKANYLLKFSAYVLFLNAYWTYKALQTKNLRWLGGWVGTVEGLWESLTKRGTLQTGSTNKKYAQ